MGNEVFLIRGVTMVFLKGSGKASLVTDGRRMSIHLLTKNMAKGLNLQILISKLNFY